MLFGHSGGGTIGFVMASQRKKGFKIILPVGLEKLIPVTIMQAAKAARRTDFEYGMGMPCGLMPVKGGTTITELEAIKILSGGAKAVPNAAGGLGGAEGANSACHRRRQRSGEDAPLNMWSNQKGRNCRKHMLLIANIARFLTVVSLSERNTGRRNRVR